MIKYTSITDFKMEETEKQLQMFDDHEYQIIRGSKVVIAEEEEE
jgi:hypothetical protein